MTDHQFCVQLFMYVYDFQIIVFRKTLNGMRLPVRGVEMMKDQKQAITLLLVQATVTGLNVMSGSVIDRDRHCLCESLFGMHIPVAVHTCIHAYIHIYTYIHTCTHRAA